MKHIFICCILPIQFAIIASCASDDMTEQVHNGDDDSLSVKCETDMYRCRGDEVERCDSNGEWQYHRDCAMEMRSCRDGFCVVNPDGDLDVDETGNDRDVEELNIEDQIESDNTGDMEAEYETNDCDIEAEYDYSDGDYETDHEIISEEECESDEIDIEQNDGDNDDSASDCDYYETAEGASDNDNEDQTAEMDVECDNHATYSCISGDVYWHDCNGNKTDKKEECGNCACFGDTCFITQQYDYACSENDVYWRDCQGNPVEIKDECNNCACESGACIYVANFTTACSDNDLYWYDCLGEKQVKKADCGNCGGCIDGASACMDNNQHSSSGCNNGDVYWKDCLGNWTDKETECGSNACIGDKCLDQALTPGFVGIAAGNFIMGSPEQESGREQDEIQHQVNITHDYEMSIYETTQAEFQALMGYNPSYFDTCGSDCPVDLVSWNEALKYTNELSLIYGFTECYDCTGDSPDFSCAFKEEYTTPQDCLGFRLPTEAEWEYAARAGTITPFYCGSFECLDSIAWYYYYDDEGMHGYGNSQQRTHPTGQKEPNSWGLYDMSGNVPERTGDWYGEYPTGVVDDVGGPASGTLRVSRGGGALYIQTYWRSADRQGLNPATMTNINGVRLVRSLF